MHGAYYMPVYSHGIEGLRRPDQEINVSELPTQDGYGRMISFVAFGYTNPLLLLH